MWSYLYSMISIIVYDEREITMVFMLMAMVRSKVGNLSCLSALFYYANLNCIFLKGLFLFTRAQSVRSYHQIWITWQYLVLTLWPQDLERSEGKLHVDESIRVPVGSVEHGPLRHAVEQGPEGGVAAPVVVILILPVRQVDGRDLLGHEATGGALVGGVRVRDPVPGQCLFTRPSNPHPWMQGTFINYSVGYIRVD